MSGLLDTLGRVGSALNEAAHDFAQSVSDRIDGKEVRFKSPLLASGNLEHEAFGEPIDQAAMLAKSSFSAQPTPTQSLAANNK